MSTLENPFNLVALFSTKTRKISLSLSLILLVACGINYLFLSAKLFDPKIGLWLFAAVLTISNFSKATSNETKGKKVRYLTFKFVTSFAISLLFALSFIEVFWESNLQNVLLTVVIIVSVVQLFTHTFLDWKLNETTEIGNENLNSLLQYNKPLIFTSIILTFITILVVLYI
jgi:cation transport ATPase